MTILPSMLELPATTAAGATFEGPYLTARDISYVIAVAWLAARKDVEPDVRQGYRIPDNRLRAALGRIRRNDRETEEQRFMRLRDAVIRFDTSSPVPNVMFRNGLPIRHNMDDEMTWIVFDDVRQAFAPADRFVMLPTRLLAGARFRYTVEIVMRMLAQHSRGPDGPGVVAYADDRIGLRLTMDELASRFHLPADIAPSTVLQKYLTPCIDDAWQAAGITLQIEPRRTVTHRGPGKIRDVLIFMHIPDETPLEKAMREDREGKATSWRGKAATGAKRGRPKAEVPANVVVANFGRPPLRSTFMPVHKIAGQRPAISQEDDDSDEISF